MTRSYTRSALVVCMAVLLASSVMVLLAPTAKADKPPTIVVGTSDDYPPFQMLREHGNSGEIVGSI